MRKIFYFVYACVVVYMCGLFYLDYCNLPFYSMEENSVLIKIEKPITYDNSEFIQILSETAMQTDSVISYELLEDRGEYVNVKFYTVKGKKYKQSNYLYRVFVYDFSEIEQYNLNACMYNVKSDNIEEFCNKIKQMGIYYDVIEENVQIKKYFTWENILIPVVIIITDFIFLIAASRKIFMIKRVMGYSIINIIYDFAGAVFIRVICLTVLVVCFIGLICRILL